MKRINSTLLRNININYEEDKNNMKYDEYYFNGLPVPQNIKIENLNSTGGKIYWDINNINIINKYNDKNELQYLIEKKENILREYLNLYMLQIIIQLIIWKIILIMKLEYALYGFLSTVQNGQKFLNLKLQILKIASSLKNQIKKMIKWNN